MRKLVALLSVVVLTAVPAMQAIGAEVQEGVVEEITITVKTDNGSQSYTVDEDVDLDDVAVGAKIKFLPDEKKIEILEVMQDE